MLSLRVDDKEENRMSMVCGINDDAEVQEEEGLGGSSTTTRE